MCHPTILKSEDSSLRNGSFNLNHTRPMVRGFHDQGMSNGKRIPERPGLRREKLVKSFQEWWMLLIGPSKFSSM